MTSSPVRLRGSGGTGLLDKLRRSKHGTPRRLSAWRRPCMAQWVVARAHILAALIFTLLVPGPAFAVSLGEAQTNSRIGQLLQIRIPVRADAGENLEADCIKLEGPRTDSQEDLPWLRSARLRLSMQDGQQVLNIVSAQTINSPAIMLAVRISCGTSLRREYTLLLDPPATGESLAPEVAQAVPPSSMTRSSGGDKLRTAPGESLNSIASNLFPGDTRLQRAYVGLLRSRNAEAMRGVRDSAPLPPGTELALPDTRELALMPAAPIAPPPSSAAPTSRPEAPIADKPAKTPRTRNEGKSSPRLIVGGDPMNGLQLATNIGNRKELSETERERLRTELQLIATLDEKIATQLELSEKLRQLEALQTQLQSAVQGLESRIQQQQQTLGSAPSSQPVALQSSESVPEAAAPPASPAKKPTTSAQATSSVLTGPDLPWWVWPALGAVALGIVILVVRRWRDRDIDDGQTIVTAQGEEKSNSVEGAVDDLFEPLSEEDIWPERDLPIKRPLSAGQHTDFSMLSEAGPASILHIVEDAEEHDSAVELAEIMMSFGRVQGAAQTLADFIRANPKQAVKPWVKLLEVYKVANMRAEFEALTSQLNKTFNVKPVTWDEFEVAMQAPESLESLPHLRQKLCDSWGKRECQAWLHGLLRDNRDGTRQGFPLAIIDEILLLLAILEAQLGPYKADAEPPASPPTPQPTPTITLPTDSGPATPPPADTPTMTKTLSDLDFNTTGKTDFDLGDLGIDDTDFTRTLHINLDELPDEQTQTRIEPFKQDADDKE